jgi:hypothetical protein
MKKSEQRQQVLMNSIVARVALRLRTELLNRLHKEKVRHWHMRGQHRLGPHFERGFFRGIKHAHDLIAVTLDPKKIRAQIRTVRRRKA